MIKPKAGTAIEAIVEMASSEEEPQGEPPYEEVAYFGDISGGTTAWVTLDIPAGDYCALLLPARFVERADDRAHQPWHAAAAQGGVTDKALAGTNTSTNSLTGTPLETR